MTPASAPEPFAQYLATHPDLIEALGYAPHAAQSHYEQFGAAEGRALDDFAEAIYLASHPDLLRAFRDDLEQATRHYIEHGYREKRISRFDPAQYLAAHADLRAAFGNDLGAATRHYIQHGFWEGRQFVAGLDIAAYVASYPDLIAAFGYDLHAAQTHYITTGRWEGRQVSFSAADYLAAHPDLIEAFGWDLAAATRHYIDHGYDEGRRVTGENLPAEEEVPVEPKTPAETDDFTVVCPVPGPPVLPGELDFPDFPSEIPETPPPLSDQPAPPAVLDPPPESDSTAPPEAPEAPEPSPLPVNEPESPAAPAPPPDSAPTDEGPVADETEDLDLDPSPPPPELLGPFNYGEALQKSFLFYEAQRSGDLPADHRIQWRGDSALTDGADVGVDLTGGYYDAGDHVKFGLPMAAAMTLLSWGVDEYRAAYAQTGQLQAALEAIQWGTDYLLKAHITANGQTQAFWGQVGDGQLDHSYWGPPETMTMERPAFAITPDSPGSDLAAEAAAALAAASIIFRPGDASYADTLLSNAEQLYTFADTYRGTYSEAIPASAQYYYSWSGYQDELAWGAAWLHAASVAQGEDDSGYLAKAEAEYGGIGPGWTHSWDDKAYGTAVLLAQQTGKARYRSDVENWLNSWLPGGSSVTYTAGGLAWLSQWGSLRYTANTAFLAGVYADSVRDPNGRYGDFADAQIDYMLGDNPRQASYVVGFGENYPINVHHRGASGTTEIMASANNDYLLYGALVGGPEAPDDNAYEDLRTNYLANEVALDYNAAFTGALARMAGIYGGAPLSAAELNALPEITIADL